MKFSDIVNNVGLAVLIETYWNVNGYKSISFLIVFLRINRNILECK